jgi:hypothetical protein
VERERERLIVKGIKRISKFNGSMYMGQSLTYTLSAPDSESAASAASTALPNRSRIYNTS